MVQTTLESAYKTVQKLVGDFDGNKDYYLASSYSEQSARHDFIDKFFIALGWDVNHETDKNPYEQEVKIELNVNVRGRKKRADYAFYLAPNFRDVSFYVEAKKPSIQIANADDYFQTIRYGYNSETPFGILTDFEQFHILDCRYTPSIETALDRFVKRYSYQDYLNKEKFSEIYYWFSREAVAGGSIEKRALELPKARGGAVQLGLFKGAYKPIDAALLDELDEYRNTLAHAFKNGNPDLDHWALTEIVQRVIDRLVFIRFLEDKMIEPEDIISNFGTKSESIWKDFVSTCRKLDKIYNGTIYKKHDILDAPDFKFDENVFADICEKLSSKNTPYDFDKIPIHILGSIYERFLGKVITTTAKRAKIEEKPEVKKAGGVFYTPEYIVRYIVENTIGKQIKGKTPDEISSMRFVDIACGSGSFLLGAYDALLRYHANYYNKYPKEATERDCIERDSAFLLTLHKKREILLNNIYGVDIDQQAVEVSQLSLYLKLLENETLGSTAASLRAEAGETVLPSLNKNIQCGNSLIGPDFYEGVQEEMALYESNKEEVREINPFDWETRFTDIMRNGGFDAVIGNPPYGAAFSLKEKTYLQKKVPVGNTDSAALFMIHAMTLLKSYGYIGLIVPKAFTYSSIWEKTRDNILPNISNVVDVGKVWKEVKLEQVVYIFNKSRMSPNYEAYMRAEESLEYLSTISKKACFNFGCILNSISNAELTIGMKVFAAKRRLSEFLSNTRGGMLQQYIADSKQGKQVIGGKQIAPFLIVGSKGRIPIETEIPANAIIKPNAILVQNIVAHIENPTGHIEIIATMPTENVVKSHIIIDTVNQLCPISKFGSEIFLGILSSKLLKWYLYRFVFAKAIRTMHFDGPVTEKIPVPDISKSLIDETNPLVTSLLSLHAQLPVARTDFDKERIARQIESADRHIDELVYELYGLTTEEIKIVEDSFKS